MLWLETNGFWLWGSPISRNPTIKISHLNHWCGIYLLVAGLQDCVSHAIFDLVSVYNDFPASRSLSAWPLRNLDTLPTSSFDVSFPSNHSPSYLISMATAKVALRCWEAWGLQSSPWPGCSEEIMKADKLPRPGSTRSSWLFRAGSRAPGVWLLCRVRAEVWGCHSRAAQKLQNSAESFGDGYPPTSIGIVFWVRRTLAENRGREPSDPDVDM